VLAAVGQLQFDVFADRLANEFNAPIEVLTAPYEAIRATDIGSAKRLRSIGGIRIMERSDGVMVALFESQYRLARLLADEPELTLTPITN
jgi:peptide chain release factor 3